MQDIGFVHVAPTVIKMSFGILGSGHQLKFVWSLNVLARRHLCVAHTQHNARGNTSWLKAYICLLVDAYQFYVQCLFGLNKLAFAHAWTSLELIVL